MIKYKQLLEKIGIRDDVVWGSNSPKYDNREFSKDIGGYTSYFKIGASQFGIYFSEIYGNEFELEFAREDGDDEISTGRGNDMRVFSSVLTILLAFLKENDPRYIQFTGDNPKKSSIYTRLSRDPSLKRLLDDMNYAISRTQFGMSIKKKRP